MNIQNNNISPNPFTRIHSRKIYDSSKNREKKKKNVESIEKKIHCNHWLILFIGKHTHKKAKIFHIYIHFSCHNFFLLKINLVRFHITKFVDGFCCCYVRMYMFQHTLLMHLSLSCLYNMFANTHLQ